jgi:hypothetical protein
MISDSKTKTLYQNLKGTYFVYDFIDNVNRSMFSASAS